MEHNFELINYNKNIIEKYGSKSIGRRLEKELESLYILYEEIILEIFNNNICVNIYENVNNKKMHYKFIINNNYPFLNPNIYVNNIDYKQLLISKTKSEINNLKKFKGINCLCCASLSCRNNWTPAIKLNNIITEIKKFKQIKRDLIYKLIIDIIKKKYLIDDIELYSWIC
jgi:hypothetical protein